MSLHIIATYQEIGQQQPIFLYKNCKNTEFLLKNGEAIVEITYDPIYAVQHKNCKTEWVECSSFGDKLYGSPTAIRVKNSTPTCISIRLD